MKFFDLFAGIGGFRLALEANGHECVGWCEKDKYAQKSYKAIHNTKGEFFTDDATTIETEELPDFDILAAGFPCQAFSIAGKRGGFEDARGTLFFEIARIAKAKLPKILLLENVKGLLSHSNGETFKQILKTLDELGYDVQWQVCNTKDFSTREWPVPQNRERVFFVGHLRGDSRPEVFPIIRENGLAISQIGNIDSDKRKFDNPQTGRVYDIAGISPCINTMSGGNLEPKILAERGRYNEDGTTEQQPEMRSDNNSNTITSVQKDNLVLDQKPTQFSSGEGVSYCIDKNYHKGIAPSIVGTGRRTHVIGNTVPSGHSAGNVYHPEGLAPTVRENHGKITKTVVENPEHKKKIIDVRNENFEKIADMYLEDLPDYVQKQYKKFYAENGYLPQKFNPYNCCEIEEEAPTVTTQCGSTTSSATVLIKEEDLEVKGLPIKEATKKGYDIATPGDSVNYQYPDSKTRRGRVGKNIANTLETSDNQGVVVEVDSDEEEQWESLTERRTEKAKQIRKEHREKTGEDYSPRRGKKIVPREDQLANTVTAAQTIEQKIISDTDTNLRIRKLTPKECWRLQGFPDWAFHKAEEVNSDTQLYRQAGNSVSVPVVYEIANRITRSIGLQEREYKAI